MTTANRHPGVASARESTRTATSLRIRRKRPTLAILGLPYFGQLLARQLRAKGWRARFYPHPGRDPRGWAAILADIPQADLVYLISSRVDRRAPQAALAWLRRGPIAVHWVGTDVLIALEALAKDGVARRLLDRSTHFVDAPWLIDELRPLGIEADYLALPIPLAVDEPPPLPDRFRVLLYLPVDAFDREVFDMDALLRLPRALPEVDFILIPSPAETLSAPLPPNLEARGWVSEMDALYRDVTAMVRLTSHDGMSFMAVEMLSRGRYVTWTYPLEGAILARTFDEVVAVLRYLADRHQRGDLGLNLAGREATLARFEPGRVLDALDQRLRALL